MRVRAGLYGVLWLLAASLGLASCGDDVSATDAGGPRPVGSFDGGVRTDAGTALNPTDAEARRDANMPATNEGGVDPGTVQPPPNGPLLAFPTADGFGKDAVGGRGGAVFEVTNLNDSGSGSLRACVGASGPRTCVFRTGGTITLRSPIQVQEPFLTIAGQTAPGGGIQLRVPDGASHRPMVISNTHDIVVRHLRFRPGSTATGVDGLLLVRTRNVILDHVSIYWASDENLDCYRDNENVSVQWSIMAEGLWRHSKGSLSCDDADVCTIAFHHNLYSTNRDRNPDLNLFGSVTGDSYFDLVNNVIYNPLSEFTEIWSGARVNAVGNTYRRGPITSGRAVALGLKGGPAQGTLLYQTDNVADGTLLDDPSGAEVNMPVGPLTVTPSPAATAYDAVLAEVGAFPRDTTDQRVVSGVRDRTGDVKPESPSDVGGWPTLAAGTAPTDGDHDGMPDAWEMSQGLNPADPQDGNGDLDNDGYTNLEEYLNGLAAQLLVAP